MAERRIEVTDGQEVFFHNNVGFCIGTGRMGLALQQEYQAQLKLVQEEIGFSHIRGHGLFCDDMAIYHEYEENGEKRAEYNYTYLDLVMDSYRRLGLAPFLELGFMPERMASGEQTVFYWKGNVTPPKDYALWTDMVQKLLEHLIKRYGRDEVVTWPVEVWNEPNLPGFWKNADMAEYFKLFEVTLAAVKAVDRRFRVGGPAICGVRDAEWMKAFLDYCRKKRLKPDFITRHHYTTQQPEFVGHYGYAELAKPEDGFANLRTTREIVDSYPEYRGLEIHITEFNTAYIPNCPLHDTNQNAAYIAHQLSRLGDVNESWSYWTFGDIFEEQGVPFTPFHGGFGLVADGCIPKPVFWTFAFFKRLQESGGKCVHKDDNAVILKKENGDYLGVAWNPQAGEEAQELTLRLLLPVERERYTLVLKTVDEECCNPLRLWHALGEPANPDEEQKKLLLEGARPLVTASIVRADADKRAAFSLALGKNAVVLFSLSALEPEGDRGYDYERVIKGLG